MPITSLQLITVTGKFLRLDGSPAGGTVTFTTSEVLQNPAANEIIYPVPFVATLDGTGAFTIILPSTNDPDLSPTGWVYEVVENIAGSSRARKYNIQLPYNLSGATIDLADVSPVVEPSAVTAYALVGHDHVDIYAETATVLLKADNLVGIANRDIARRTLDAAKWAPTEVDVNLPRAVHTSPLVTPTYDGSGQAVHPDVVVFSEPWNGYRYWMAMTPYPNTVDTWENPSILASNDGVTWVVPAGLVNPIDSPTTGFYPDPCLIRIGDVLWCIYATNKAKFSTDGVTWSARQTLTFGDASTNHLSPVVEEHEGTFHYWAVNTGANPNTLIHRSGADVLTYGPATVCTVNGGPAGRDLWHISMRRVAGGYIGVFAYVDLNASGSNSDLHLAFSSDGLTWQVGTAPLLGREITDANFSAGVYRACLVPTDGKDGTIGVLWYSGLNGGGQWRIARTILKTTEPEALTTFAQTNRPNSFTRPQVIVGDARNLAKNPTLLQPNGVIPADWTNNMVGAQGHAWDVETESWTVENTSELSRNITQIRTDLTLVVGEWWTFSFEGRNASSNGAWQAQMIFRDAGGTQLSSHVTELWNTQAFYRTSKSAQVPANAVRLDIVIVCNAILAAAERYWFRKVQLERSERATRWTPGPTATIRLPPSAQAGALHVVGPLTTAGAPLLSAVTKEGAVQVPQYTTAARNALTAAVFGKGAHLYDTTLDKPIYSTGTVFKDYAGTTV